MPGNREAVQLRAELLKYREQTRAGKYPDALRERAEAHVKQRISAGATSAEIASELGVRKSTAERWASGGERTGKALLPAAPTSTRTLSLVPIVVRPEHREVSSSMRIRFEFPDGTRMQVSGVASRDLAEAVDMLRRTR